MSLIFLTCCSLLLVQTDAGADTSTGLPVEILRVDGSETRGLLESIAPDVRLKMNDGTELSLALDDISAIRPQSKQKSPPRIAAPFWIELANGSQFLGTIESTEHERVSIRTNLGGVARPLLDAFRLIRNQDTSTVAAKRLEESYAARENAEGAATDDELVVAKDNQALVLRGTLRGIDAKNVSFTWNDREIDVPWSRAAGVIFGRVESRSASCTIETLDGQRFCGQIAEGDDVRVLLQSSAFERIEIPWPHIAEIRLQSRRVTYLSALKPLHYEHKNLLGVAWPYGMDEALDGGELRLNKKKYAHGLVLHSDSRIEFNIGGEFQTMTATVGIFNRYPQGVADVRILGDGRELWSTKDVRAGSPQELQIQVAGVRALEIFVDSGANLDLGDHVLLADAKLIREER